MTPNTKAAAAEAKAAAARARALRPWYRKKRYQALSIAGGFFTLLMLVGGGHKNDAPPAGSGVPASASTPATPKPAPTPTVIAADLACFAATQAVPASLKAPSTAKFTDCRAGGKDWGAIESVNDSGQHVWIVQGVIDSQNSFGAMLRSTWQATVTSLGDGKTRVVVDWVR